MAYLLRFERRALEDTAKLNPDIAARLIDKLEWFASRNNPLEFAIRLQDSEIGDYRFRIGDYRVIFDVVKQIIIIRRIGHRRSIYL